MPTLQAIVMVISLAVSGSADAVEGRVVDAATGAPVAGAEVTVVGERRAVRTDKNGRFHWSVAPSLPATVVIVLADGRVGRPIQLTAIDTAAELTLAVDAALRESVDVLGAAPTIDASPAAAASLLAVGDLELRHPPTLTQALDGVPGVSPVSEGQAAVPAIRGLARGRTLILVDGGRATAERRAGASASFLDPASIRTIEVARGPGSVAYGSDAFGGVIAARTRGPHYDKAVRVRFAGTGGWGVPEASGELEIAKGHESGGVLVAIRARDLGDYDAPRGVVPNSGWRDRGMRARWEQLTETGLFSVAWQSDFGRDLGRPRSDSDLILATSPFDDSHRLTVSYEHRGIGGLRNLRIDGLAGASRQRTDQDRLPMSSRPRSIERADLSSRDLQVRVTGERILGPARVHVGADVQGRYGLEALDATLAYDLGGTLASQATTVSIDSADRTSIGLFAESDAELAPRLRVSGGLRVDAVRNTNAGGFFGDRTVSNAALAGLFALTLAPATGLTVTAQVARGFRDPILSDRFYRGPVGRGFIEGNPELRPETSLQFDLSARYAAGPFRLAAAAYRYRITDLVERYAETATLFLFRNRGRADLRGVEVEAQTSLPRGFSLTATAETSRGRDAADRTPLDDVAPAAGSLTIRHAAGGRVASYARIKRVGSHDEAGPSEAPTRAHTTIEAGASWRLSGHLQLQGRLRNLSNDSFESSASPRWVWAPGRHGSLTMVASF